MTKKCLFDDIIECLNLLGEKKSAVSVNQEVLTEFLSERNMAAAPKSSCQGVDVASLNLAELQAVTAHCHLCSLHERRTKVVFGEGNPAAELMFIGEGPGQEEDRLGRPFVGEAGQLLDKMITAMQFSRQEVYIANIVKCRPPNNRNPEPDEAEKCLPYLARQIELVNPKVIVLLGAVAMRFLVQKEGISRARGTWLEYRGIPTMPTYHPAYLLRNQAAKKDVWSDLQQVMRVLGKKPKGAA